MMFVDQKDAHTRLSRFVQADNQKTFLLSSKNLRNLLANVTLFFLGCVDCVGVLCELYDKNIQQ